eukprot:3211389-Heterocapsa_arctica.AAC.1
MGLSSSELVENDQRVARNSMATTMRSEIMLLMFYPHANKYGNDRAPVCGAPVNPEPIAVVVVVVVVVVV